MLKSAISELPDIKRKLIFAVITILIAIIAYLFVIRESIGNLRTMKSQHALLIQQAATLENNHKNLANRQFQRQKLEDSYKTYMNRLMQHFNAISLANAIAQTASTSNLQLNSIKPEQINKIELYKIYPITITASGTYQQFQQFSSQLLKLNYFLILDSFILEKPNDSNILNILMTLNFYTIQ